MIRNPDGSIGSPCVNWCEMNPLNHYCFGCYRSMNEISSWTTFSELEKQGVWDDLQKRKQNLGASD
jgi:predicted Fe-S protein YdhL (DUF1289 family)